MPLRIEANLWAAPSFLGPLPEGWEGGVWDHVGMARPLQLVLNEPSIQTLSLRLRQRSLDLSERHAELVPLGPGRDSPHLGIKNPARREQEGSQ
jgi:hypothetical protein